MIDFKRLADKLQGFRFDERFHLGLGDIRLSCGDGDDVIAALTEAEILRDYAIIADLMCNLTYCPGGRPIASGYVCAHCGKDPTDGKCGKPRKETSND